MKIPASIRRLYDDQKEINDRLQRAVDRRIMSLRDPRWHYVSRVKELPSFALKIESGRFQDPEALEDFFACTIVVANATEIEKVETLIQDNFSVKKRRPPKPDETHKRSDAFPFDDLRLYVTLPANPALPSSDLADLLFEMQIKTFLQHAWTIATHELVYKSDDVSWSKERIAYQIKAMLEHAEISIQEAESLATSDALAKEDNRTAETKTTIALVKSQWGKEDLPEDVRRLAQNITDLLQQLHLEITRLEEILNRGKAERSGAHPSNLSPYGTIVQYLFSAEKAKMISFLEKEGSRVKLLIPDEVELPAEIDRTRLRNAIFVSAGATRRQESE